MFSSTILTFAFAALAAQITAAPDSLPNASFSQLPAYFAPAAYPQNPGAIKQIRNTLALYPLYIDGKDFAALHLVFIDDVVANYSEPLDILTPLSTLETTLAASLAKVTTQHLLGTQVVDLEDEHGARALTYFRAAHFGTGAYEGEVLCAYGQYRDVLVETRLGWRVGERTLAYNGPLIGNSSIFA